MEPRAAFQAAWLVVLTDCCMCSPAFLRYFRREFCLQRRIARWGRFCNVQKPFAICAAGPEEAHSYNLLQRLSYVFVIFVAFPLVIWTVGAIADVGFRVSGDGESAGRAASARTIHFLFRFSYCCLCWCMC